MMKAVILYFMSFFICRMAMAQVVIALLFGDKLNTGKLEFGIVVSPTFTDISGIESDYKTGLNLGLYFNINPDSKLFLHIEGIAKGTFGAKGIAPYPTGNDSLDALFKNGSVLRKIKNFSLPVLARYSFTKKFFAEAGIQADMFLGTKDIFESDEDGNDLTYTIKTTDDYTKLDFGFAGGLFYKFREDRRSMGIGLRYFQGVTDIYKTAEGNQLNKMWVINVTIPVGAGHKNGQESNPASPN